MSNPHIEGKQAFEFLDKSANDQIILKKNITSTKTWLPISKQSCVYKVLSFQVS